MRPTSTFLLLSLTARFQSFSICFVLAIEPASQTVRHSAISNIQSNLYPNQYEYIHTVDENIIGASKIPNNYWYSNSAIAIIRISLLFPK